MGSTGCKGAHRRVADGPASTVQPGLRRDAVEADAAIAAGGRLGLTGAAVVSFGCVAEAAAGCAAAGHAAAAGLRAGLH